MSSTRLDELHAKLNAATAAVSIEATEPTTTASGVACGHALFDAQPEDADSAAAGRSCRKKRYTEKGLAWASDVEQTKKNSARVRQTQEQNAAEAAARAINELSQSRSQPPTAAASQTQFKTQWETISFERAALLSALASQVTYPIADLSTQELIGLYEDIRDSQASQRESQVQQTEATQHVTTPLGVGGGFHCDVNPPIVSGPLPLAEGAIMSNTETESEDETDAECQPSKCARVTAIDNTDTESESDLEPLGVACAQIPSITAVLGAQPQSTGGADNDLGLSAGVPTPNVVRTYSKSRTHVNLDPTVHSQHSQRVASSPSLGDWQSDSPAPVLTSAQRATAIPSSPSPAESLPTHGAQPREPQLSEVVLAQPTPATCSTQQRKRKSKKTKPKQSGHAQACFLATPTWLDGPNTSRTTADARTDMLANAYDRLKGLAASVIGQPEPPGARQRPPSLLPTGRLSKPSGGRNSKSKAHNVAMGDDEADRQATIAQAAGKRVSGRKPKPLASDFDGYERQVLILAKLLLFAYAVAYGPYLTCETYLSWAALIYEIAWSQSFPAVPFQVPAPEVYEMVNNLATLRGNVKGWLRPILEHKLGFCKPALNEDDLRHNLQIFKALYPNHFHCQDAERRKGHYQANILARCIGAALFNGPQSIGVMFRDFFDPMPMITVAYVLANIEFCLEEWSTGQFKLSDLKSGHMAEKYLMQMKNLQNFRSVAESRCFRLRQNWFKYGLIYSGASLVNAPDPVDNLINIDEFRPDTSDSESDSESTSDSVREVRHSPEPLPEVDENGRYTAQAKGKGRAVR